MISNTILSKKYKFCRSIIYIYTYILHSFMCYEQNLEFFMYFFQFTHHLRMPQISPNIRLSPVQGKLQIDELAKYQHVKLYTHLKVKEGQPQAVLKPVISRFKIRRCIHWILKYYLRKRVFLVTHCHFCHFIHVIFFKEGDATRDFHSCKGLHWTAINNYGTINLCSVSPIQQLSQFGSFCFFLPFFL